MQPCDIRFQHTGGSTGLFFVASVVALFVAFFAGIFLDYGVHNDYSVFSYDNSRCCLGYPESQHLFWIGRPLGALLLNVQLMFVDEISGFRWLRFAGFLLLLIFFVTVYVQFRREGEDHNIEAFLASFCLALLPAPILYVFWVTSAVPGLLNLVLVALAYSMVYAGYSRGRWGHLSIVSGYVLLFITFFIYPPTSYFFLVFTCWRAVMTERLRETIWLTRSCSELIAVAVVSGIYLAVLQRFSTPEFVGLFFDHVYDKPTGSYATDLADNLLQRMDVFEAFAAMALQMWFQDWIAYPLAIGALLLMPLLAALVRSSTLRSGVGQLSVVARLLLPVASFILASSPTVLAAGGFVATRNTYVGSAIAAVVLLAHIFNVFKALNQRRIGFALGSILALLALIAGSIRFTAAAFNAHLELNYVRRAFAQYSHPIHGVTVYPPTSGATIVGRPVASDFALMAVNWSPIDGFPRGVLKEMGLDYRWIPVTYSKSAGTVHVVGNIEICMAGAGFSEDIFGRESCNRHPSLAMDNRVDVWITLRKRGGVKYGIDRAFDRSLEPTSFWETLISSPVVFDAEFRSPQTLLSYSFHSGAYEADRMPVSWKVLGWADGGEWVSVDTRSDSSPWRLNEERRYFISSARPYKIYRFMFETSGHPNVLRIYEIGFAPNGS